MDVRSFVIQNQLKPADAVVLRKKFMGMFSHYVIYLGTRHGEPVFVANFFKGVSIISNNEINKQLVVYQPEKVDRFPGNVYQRRNAIERAWSKIGQKPYGLISNNCEHYKNWVHYGREISEQVSNVGKGTMVIGGAMALGGVLSSNSKMRNWGIGILIIGAILNSLAERKEQS